MAALSILVSVVLLFHGAYSEDGLKELRRIVDKYDQHVHTLADNQDALQRQVSQQSHVINTLSASVDTLKSENVDLKRTINALEKQLMIHVTTTTAQLKEDFKLTKEFPKHQGATQREHGHKDSLNEASSVRNKTAVNDARTYAAVEHAIPVDNDQQRTANLTEEDLPELTQHQPAINRAKRIVKSLGLFRDTANIERQSRCK